jgi:uncharacterized protein (TIGR03546 family)
MIATLVRPVRRLTNALLSSDTPHQLALGFALGMVIGLMPKGNLIVLSLCVLLFSLRVNAGLGLIAAVLFSCVAPLVGSFADRLGLAVLSADSLQASYAAVFKLPLGPWLGFHNTVVTGSLLIGLYLAYPVYWFSLVGLRRLQRHGAGRRELEAGRSTDTDFVTGSALYESSHRAGRRVA